MRHLPFKNFFFTFVAILLTTIAWCQRADQPLPGDGTSASPYHIDDIKLWNAFVEYVNDGIGGFIYEGKYIRLDTDIAAATESVGTSENYFAGYFDGNGHTITLNMSGDNVALFGCIDGRSNQIEIKNLTVNVTITTTNQYAAGFVSSIYNKSQFTSCTSSVTIENSSTGTIYCAGFIGNLAAESSTTFKFCVYNGIIDAPTARMAAGYVGSVGNKCTLKIYESTQAYQSMRCSDIKTFYQLASGATPSTIDIGTSSNITYYLRVGDSSWHNMSGNKILGKDAPKTVPTDAIAKKYVRGTQSYYVPKAYASGVATYYSEHPSYPLDPEPVVTYYGKELTWKSDYNYTINTGTKKIIFNATGDDNGVYYGSGLAVSYNIVDVSDWTKLAAVLKTATGNAKVLKLQEKTVYRAGSSDTQLTIDGSGAVYLYLNGSTLDRNLKGKDGGVAGGSVLNIGSKSTVKIYGDGTITGGNNMGSGGGIYNKGKLELYDVVVTNCEANYLSNNDYGTGGAVFSSSSFRMVGGELSYNKSHGGGGGVNATGTSMYIENVYIHDNYCNSKGGGIRVKVNGAQIKNCSIVDNELEEHDNLASASDGGGIHNDGSSPLTITNCTISRNNAHRWGGGIYSIGGTVYANGCTIQQNTSSDNGGGIFVNAGKFYLRNNGSTGNTVSENLSDNTGGIFVASGATLYVKDKVVIQYNIGTAIKKNLFFDGASGKLYVEGNTLNTDSKICLSRNSVGDITSGLKNASVNVKRCIVSDNYLNYWVLRPTTGEVALAASFDWSKPTNTAPGYKYWRLAGSSTNYVTYTEASNTYEIKAPIIIPSGNKYTASAITISDEGCIFIQDSGELVYSATSIPVSVMKEISAASKDDRAEIRGWKIISSPIKNVLLSGRDANVNIITANSEPYNFDLLYYDEPNSYWRSYTSSTSSTYFPDNELKVGTGYLYRNLKDFTIEFIGATNKGDVTCEVSAKHSNASVRGFNIIGNPFTHSIHKGSGYAISSDILNAGYYKPLNNGKWQTIRDGDPDEPIRPCEGVLVQANANGTVTIRNTDAAPSKRSVGDENSIKFMVANSDYEDETYVVFTEGYGLSKINHRNPDIPMLYIDREGEDYAIATMNNDVKVFNLNFKAQTTGRYTLSYEAEGAFSYLHLIDRLTGEDVDMLLEQTYSFIASPADTDKRFIVHIDDNAGADGQDVFAYQNGDDVLVSGEGELQVFDLMGRFVMSKYVSGNELVNLTSGGVYILRLLDGDKLKTQKIVVR